MRNPEIPDTKDDKDDTQPKVSNADKCRAWKARQSPEWKTGEKQRLKERDRRRAVAKREWQLTQRLMIPSKPMGRDPEKFKKCRGLAKVKAQQKMNEVQEQLESRLQSAKHTQERMLAMGEELRELRAILRVKFEVCGLPDTNFEDWFDELKDERAEIQNDRQAEPDRVEELEAQVEGLEAENVSLTQELALAKKEVRRNDKTIRMLNENCDELAERVMKLKKRERKNATLK